MSRAGFEADRFRVVVREWARVREVHRPARRRFPARGPFARQHRLVGGRRGLLLTADNVGQHPVFALDVATGKARLVGRKARPRAPARGPDPVRAQHPPRADELYTVARDAATSARSRADAEKVAAVRFGKPEQFSFKGALGETVYGWIVHPWTSIPRRSTRSPS